MAVKKATARGRKAVAAAAADVAAKESAVSGEDETDSERRQEEEDAEGSTANRERDDSAQPSATTGVLDSVQGEIILLKALAKHRPLGLSRHFEMAALLALINGQLAELADGSSEGVEGPEVWDKLRSMWDMERLNGDITPPFPSPPASSASATTPSADGDPLSSTTFHLPLTGAFDELLDARRLHSATSRSPASDPPSRASAASTAVAGAGSTSRSNKRGRDLMGDSGSSLTGTEDEDEPAAEDEEEEAEVDHDATEESEEESEELTPVKKRKRRR